MVSEIPTVDFTCFGDGTLEARQEAARALRDACTRLGAVHLTGIGLPEDRLHEAFAWSKKLFDLSMEDKMKAPHPPTAMPHRGYSGPGLEKVYSKAERDQDEAARRDGATLRKIEDFKESYEVGSEENAAQPNVWLPEATLPGYRDFTLALYEDMHVAAMRILDALCLALELSDADRAHLKKLHSGTNNQLRLLHYPPVESEKLAQRVVGRMPPHQDWSSFTFLFQDSMGGLEYQDPRDPDTYIPAKPTTNACILNVGDMLQRYSNDIFPSAMHRVTIPPSKTGVLGSRYSIPYFVAPDHEALVACLPSCVEGEPKYEPVRWCDYGEYMSKHMYRGDGKDSSKDGKQE